MKTFRYKLDFYYQLSIIYLITLIVYVIVWGALIENDFEAIFRDPIFFIMLFFVLFSFTVLIVNRIRNRRLVIEESEIKFVDNIKAWTLPFKDIEWMHITREKKVRTAGRKQVVIIKKKGRKRLLKLRVGRYERPDEFLGELKKISDKVPKRERTRKKDRVRRRKN